MKEDRRSEQRRHLSLVIHHEPHPLDGDTYKAVILTGQNLLRELEERGIQECWIWKNADRVVVAWKE